MPIAGGENNVGAHEFRLLIDQECYDVVQPEATVSGGLGMLRTIAGYAELRGKLCVRPTTAATASVSPPTST